MAASRSAEDELKKQTLYSGLAVTFYMTVSIGLVFLNRVVLTDKRERVGALFVSWYQFVVAYVIIIIITTLCPNVPLLKLFPPLRYDPSVFLKVIPVSVAYLLMIGFNNKCLEYVSVSSYQIVRSLTIAFNIIFTYIVLGDSTSLRASSSAFSSASRARSVFRFAAAFTACALRFSSRCTRSSSRR
jgi:GDP-fucose transporter C1